MDKITEVWLTEMEALSQKAQAGPWGREVAGIEGDNYIAATGPWYRLGRRLNDQAADDAAFIAEARTFVPKAIDEIRRLRAALLAADVLRDRAVRLLSEGE